MFKVMPYFAVETPIFLLRHVSSVCGGRLLRYLTRLERIYGLSLDSRIVSAIDAMYDRLLMRTIKAEFRSGYFNWQFGYAVIWH